MAIRSAYWLGLAYFTYFFAYGIYLPFWAVWLKGTGLDAEKIGLLLGAGMMATALVPVATSFLQKPKAPQQ